jgi:hypothetical protein
MTLYKRGNVYWSYVSVDGVRHARSTETGNRRLAEQIDQKHREELRLRDVLSPEFKPEMTFAELVGRFLDEGCAKAWHRDRLKILLPYFSHFTIAKIIKSAIRQYRAERHRRKTLTETTVNRDIECLRHLLYWAVDEGFIAANPIARIRLERERRKKKPVLSLAEEVVLLTALSPHLQSIVVVGPSEATDTAQAKAGRKPWVKKTPVEVVLDQIAKQEDKVNDMREELKKEERELVKLQQAKKVLEAT